MSVSSNGSKGHQRRLKRRPDTNGNATATQFLDWSASCRSIPPNRDGLGVKTRFTGRVPNPTAFLTTPTPCPMNTRNGLEITSPTHRHRVATTASYSIHPFVTIVTRSASSLPPLTPSVADPESEGGDHGTLVQSAMAFAPRPPHRCVAGLAHDPWTRHPMPFAMSMC